MKRNLLFLSLISFLLGVKLSAQELIPATFEDLSLKPESHWCGNTEDPDYTSGSFKSGSFEFSNSYTAEYNFWCYFSYANYTGNQFTGDYSTQQWNNTAGGGYESENYAVVFADTYNGPTIATVTGFEKGAVIPGVWVVNSAWVADAIENGDGMSGPFEKGDKLTLVITGYDAAEKESKAEFLLADYTSENEEEWYAVNNWKWINLETLGSVTKLRFDVISTKVNEYGQTTPAYVCIDNLGMAENSGIRESVSEDSFKLAVENDSVVISGMYSDFTAANYSVAGVQVDNRAAAMGSACLKLIDGLNIITIRTSNSTLTYKVIK